MNTVMDVAHARSLFAKVCDKCDSRPLREMLFNPKYHAFLKPLRQRFRGHYRVHLHDGRVGFEVLHRLKNGQITTMMTRRAFSTEKALEYALAATENCHFFTE